MKLNFLKRTFADVYGQSYIPVNYTGPEYTQTITINTENVYVHDSVFRSCSSTSNGGALSCSTSVVRFLVERSSFISCSTSSDYGGAIYFKSTTTGQCVLSRICGFNCISSRIGYIWGMCAYICVSNDINYKNHVNDSIITQSINKNMDSVFSLILFYGNISCPSINLTNNFCNRYPSLGCRSLGSATSNTFSLSYSSVVNNTADGNYGWGCFQIYCTDSTTSQLIDTCNVISNKITSDSYGIFDMYVNFFIMNSCILGNAIGKRVFTIYSGKLTLLNCTIDDDIFTSRRFTGSVTVVKTIKSTFINALSHIATQKCDSYFDSFGTLSVKPYVPTEYFRNLISCNIRKPIIDPFRYFEFIFLLTMLPSDPSYDNYFNPNFIIASGI
jgi:hypothetical protein